MKTRLLHHLQFILLLLMATAISAAAAAPPAPALIAPASGASLPSPLTLSWSAVTDPSGILGYNWQISTSSSFATITAQSSTNGQTQDTASGLPNGTYFWRAQAVNNAFVQGAWSQPGNFTITGAGPGQPAAPTLAPTKAYSTFHPREVIGFSWSPVPGAATYLLQASTDPSFPIVTRIQFDNIPNPVFSFAIADEGFYYARVYAVSAGRILSVPSNVITFSVFYNNPLPAPPSPLSPGNGVTLNLPITLTWTDVANPQPSGYELEIAKDSGFNQVEESAPQLNNASRTELSLTPGTKFWRVRSHQGDSSPTTAAVTAWSKSGSFTVSQAPPAPVSLALATSAFYSGNTTWVALQLSTAAGANGAVINLTSSNPLAAPAPATVNMPPNTGWTQFQMQAGQVTADTPVTLTATLNSGSASVQFTVLPPSLKSISVSPGTINGGAQPQAIIMLNGQAPAGGAVIDVASDSPAALAPALVNVAAGSPSAVFAISTTQVNANTLVHISAGWNGASVSTPITLTPQGQPSAISLSPASVTGTGGSFATVSIASPAAVDQIFQVTSSNPAAALTPNSVLIPAGAVRGGFNIFTRIVSAPTSVTISVSGGGVTRSATLSLNPLSAPPPTTSATLSVSAMGRSGERVTSTPAGISVAVGSTGSSSFASGTAITLSVSNGRDAIWSGACSSGGQKTKTCTLTLNANSSVSANVQ
ncbi:MAG TPA: hypothetical protein VJN64_12415 [Terriglobales bacterium]|nr:hypothetical protein [Terriglobales bacterium]